MDYKSSDFYEYVNNIANQIKELIYFYDDLIRDDYIKKKGWLIMGKNLFVKKYEGSILQVCTIRDLMSITSNMNKKSNSGICS